MSRVVAGTLLLPNGQPMANASIYFTAKRTEPVSIIEGSNTFFNTSSAGVYNQSVVNGFYAVSIEYIADSSGAHTRRWPLGDVFIEDGATTTLEALIIASNAPDDLALGVFYQILEEAQEAAESAQASAAAAAASAAAITVGTGPTNIPNTTILNTRLGTTGNLGTAAQRNIGTATNNVPDVAQLNTRLGTTGNLGNAAQRNVGTATNNVPDVAQLNTRLGTTGNLGNAAQANVTTSAVSTTEGAVPIIRSSGGIFGLGGAPFSAPPDSVGSTSFNLTDGSSSATIFNETGFIFLHSSRGIGTGWQVGTNVGGNLGSNSFRFFGRRTSAVVGDFGGVAEFWTDKNQLQIGTTAATARAAIDSSVLPAYTVATVPSASANANKLIVVTNAASGRNSYLSDGTNWRDPARVVLS